jgi:Reeler domain-containing protein
LRITAPAAIALTTACLLLAPRPMRAHPSGPDPGVTGGFGEPTCNQSGCHNSFTLNAGRAAALGDLEISGLPKTYEPGKSYPIKLVVSHTQDRAAWGFQLAARFAQSGAQAGRLQPLDTATQIVEASGVQYIEHTLDGIASNTFTFTWTAPTAASGEVAVHAAGNAADGDFGPGGDYIYAASVSIAAPSK